MNSEKWVERLFSCVARLKAGRDLSTMQRLDDWQGHLHRKFATIHIAGTNGKGSVALKIAAGLQASGLKVGLYMSPHISTYRERIQVNGELMEEEFAAQFLPKLFSFVDQEHLTPGFFDLLTVMAFEYFAMKKVDVAVLEVGLGGQFDATNIVMPKLSIITSVDYDHCDVLGTSLDQIAKAKAGIIKKGVPVVIGPEAQLPPILHAAHNQAILVSSNYNFYDRENNATARAALEFLKIPEEAIVTSLSHRPPCRFEILGSQPIVLDVAHNADAFAHLKRAWDVHFPGQRFNLILAMGQDRDPVACVQQLDDLPIKIFCVSNDHPRLSSASHLQQQLQAHGILHAESSLSIAEALQVPGPIVVCGSFFIMSDVRRLLGIEEPRDSLVAVPVREDF